MTKRDSSQKWLEAGYELFSAEGPEAIHVEKIARILGVNKSGFYHYFGDRDIYLDRLMEYHLKQAKLFMDDAKKADKFFPDYLDLLYKHRSAMMVQMHLRRHTDNPIFDETFHLVARENDKVIMPLWCEYIRIPGNYDLAYELWDILRDIYFIRINKENFSKESFYSLVTEFSEVLRVLRKYASKNDILPAEEK